jgi:hypothetical protein
MVIYNAEMFIHHQNLSGMYKVPTLLWCRMQCVMFIVENPDLFAAQYFIGESLVRLRFAYSFCWLGLRLEGVALPTN